MITHDQRWSLPPGNTLVLSRWQATAVIAEFAESSRVCTGVCGLAGGRPAYTLGGRARRVTQVRAVRCSLTWER